MNPAKNKLFPDKTPHQRYKIILCQSCGGQENNTSHCVLDNRHKLGERFNMKLMLRLFHQTHESSLHSHTRLQWFN